MRRLRRIGAYGIVGDGGRVLLVRGSALADFPGVWQIPGGGVEQGEHPADAVVREVAEETGLAVVVTGLRDVVADVTVRAGAAGVEPVALHHDRVIYELAATGGAVRDEPVGTTDRAAWFTPEELSGIPLMRMTAELFGLPVTPLPPSRPSEPEPEPAEAPSVGQRFGAYALATDRAGRVLLALVADGYLSGGRWHLPGGGIDHGEQPRAALLRELAEETNQVGRVLGLLGVSSDHNHGGTWNRHVVRAIYRVAVDAPTDARVTEVAGSTAQACWVFPAQTGDMPLTGLAREWVRTLH